MEGDAISRSLDRTIASVERNTAAVVRLDERTQTQTDAIRRVELLLQKLAPLGAEVAALTRVTAQQGESIGELRADLHELRSRQSHVEAAARVDSARNEGRKEGLTWAGKAAVSLAGAGGGAMLVDVLSRWFGG